MPRQQLVARDGLQREQQVLDGDVLVVELLRLFACLVERARQLGRDARLLRRAFHGRLLREPRFRLRPQRLRRRHERARQLLVEQRQQQMLGVDLGVAAAPRVLDRGGNGFLRLDRQPVEVHLSLRSPGQSQLALRVRVEDDLAPVLPVHRLDGVAHLPLQPVEPLAQCRELVLEREHAPHAREVEPELGRQPLDLAQPLEVVLGVQARAARRPPGTNEPLRLVDTQRLRVHADDVGGDADHVTRAAGRS